MNTVLLGIRLSEEQTHWIDNLKSPWHELAHPKLRSSRSEPTTLGDPSTMRLYVCLHLHVCTNACMYTALFHRVRVGSQTSTLDR